MKVTAKNPNTRTIFLLPNAFIVWGDNIGFSETDFDNNMNNSPITDDSCIDLYRHCSPIKRSVVAYGKVFDDYMLKPNEMITTTKSFYIPQGQYDLLDSAIRIPTTTDPNALTLNYCYNKDKDTIIFDMYTKKDIIFYYFLQEIKPRHIKMDSNGWYDDSESDLLDKLGFQCYGSKSSICLW